MVRCKTYQFYTNQNSMPKAIIIIHQHRSITLFFLRGIARWSQPLIQQSSCLLTTLLGHVCWCVVGVVFYSTSLLSLPRLVLPSLLTDASAASTAAAISSPTSLCSQVSVLSVRGLHTVVKPASLSFLYTLASAARSSQPYRFSSLLHECGNSKKQLWEWQARDEPKLLDQLWRRVLLGDSVLCIRTRPYMPMADWNRSSGLGRLSRFTVSLLTVTRKEGYGAHVRVYI